MANGCGRRFFLAGRFDDGEDLRHPADALHAAGAEKQPGPGADELRVLAEAEDGRRRLVRVDVLGRHDALQNGRLLDGADVHRRLRADLHAHRLLVRLQLGRLHCYRRLAVNQITIE